MENKAIGDTVATNLSKSGCAGVKSKKKDKVAATIQQRAGGKVSIFFTI